MSTFQRNSFQKHQEDDIHRKSSGSNNITSIKIQQQEKNSGKYLKVFIQNIYMNIIRVQRSNDYRF